MGDKPEITKLSQTNTIHECSNPWITINTLFSIRFVHRHPISYTAEYLIKTQGHSHLFQNESTFIKQNTA